MNKRGFNDPYSLTIIRDLRQLSDAELYDRERRIKEDLQNSPLSYVNTLRMFKLVRMELGDRNLLDVD